MRKEKVEMAVKLIGNEASNTAILLGGKGVMCCEPFSPQANIRVRGCPSGKLLCGVEWSGKCMDGCTIYRDDLFQVRLLKRTYVHR